VGRKGTAHRFGDLDVMDVSGGKMVGEIQLNGVVFLAVNRRPAKVTILDLACGRRW